MYIFGPVILTLPFERAQDIGLDANGSSIDDGPGTAFEKNSTNRQWVVHVYRYFKYTYTYLSIYIFHLNLALLSKPKHGKASPMLLSRPQYN